VHADFQIGALFGADSRETGCCYFTTIVIDDCAVPKS
jgi:hypothetical protein